MHQVFKECPTCEQYGHFGQGIMPQHQCKQTWNVWPDTDGGPEATAKYRIVYADDAESAAERAARRWSDDEPWEGRLYVRQWDGSEEEQGPTATFELAPYYSLEFEITAK